jgi:hypothetical protein
VVWVCDDAMMEISSVVIIDIDKKELDFDTFVEASIVWSSLMGMCICWQP